MLALTATGIRDHPLELTEVSEPEPAPNEVTIQVARASVNRGEFHRISVAASGWRPGWDIAGTVVAEAADGSGPRLGDRVVALATGAGWAQRAAVPAENVVVVADCISLSAASTLPVAGVTALRTIRAGGLLLGRRVLITGAASGVGRIAMRLAQLSGANTTGIASTHQPETRHQWPATRLVGSFEEALDQDYHLILESTGGASLELAMKSVAPGGKIVTFGNSSRGHSSILINDYYIKNGSQLIAYFIFDDIRQNTIGDDLRILLALVQHDHLDPGITLELPWSNANEILRAFDARNIRGKAVLEITN